MNATFVSAGGGLVMALAVGILAPVTRMDRGRALYPAVLVMIAALYGLFAAIDGTPAVIVTEVACMTPFAALALLGFRRSLWIVVGALACHGVYDFVHARIVTNTGVPSWWPVFCLAYDATAALYLAFLLTRSTVPAVFRR
jgi:hypothetical protein